MGMDVQRYRLDFRILYWVQESRRSEGWTRFWTFFTFLGDAGWFWIATTIALLSAPALRPVGLAALRSLLVSSLLVNLLLKPLFGRDRPFEAFPVLEPLGRRPKDRSFPSGHTSASFSVAVVCAAALPLPAGVLFLTIASLIGLSRIYLGVHFPSDVAAGALVGTIVALLCR